MNKPAFERKFILLALGAFAIFSVGGVITTVLPPFLNPEMYKSEDNKAHEYTEQEIRGVRIYQREGCVYCHTQQIRFNGDKDHFGTSDGKRYGWRMVDAPDSKSEEYVNDRPHFLGTKRTGPDLARVGGKYSSEWHRAHMINPRDMGEKFIKAGQPNPQAGSIMPTFKHLTEQELDDLIAYMQTLGRNYKDDKGRGWRVYTDKKTGKEIELNDYEE